MAHNGIVYLLHLERSYRHARHYIGFTQNLEQRLADHRAGRGSPLIAAAIADGIEFELAAIWEGDRYDERRLHRQKNTRTRLCPICIAQAQAGTERTVDLVDEILLSVLAATRQPATLPASERSCAAAGSGSGASTAAWSCSHSRAGLPRPGCLARSPGKPVRGAARTSRHRRVGCRRRPDRRGRRSVPSQASHPDGCVEVGERPRHPGGGPNPEGDP
jgi:hypothetical protein